MEYSQCMTIIENARKKVAEDIQKEIIATRMKTQKSKYQKLKVQSSANLLKNVTNLKSTRPPFSSFNKDDSPRKTDSKSENSESFILVNSDKLDISIQPLNSKVTLDDGFNPFLYDNGHQQKLSADEKNVRNEGNPNIKIDLRRDNKISSGNDQPHQTLEDISSQQKTQQKVVRRKFVYYDQHCKTLFDHCKFLSFYSFSTKI